MCLGDRVICKQFHQSTEDGDSSTDWSENIDFQCKEEEDQYIPIMEITSVCSMASNAIPSDQSVRQDKGNLLIFVCDFMNCIVNRFTVTA